MAIDGGVAARHEELLEEAGRGCRTSCRSPTFSAATTPTASPAPIRPCTRPSAMNGTRTNQFDAPTSFMTSISRRRANVASRIVLTIRNSDDDEQDQREPDEDRAAPCSWRRAALGAPPRAWRRLRRRVASRTVRWMALVSSARSGTTRNEVGSASAVMFFTRSGSLRKIRLNSSSAASLSKKRNDFTSGSSVELPSRPSPI